MTDEEMDRICDNALQTYLRDSPRGVNFECPIHRGWRYSMDDYRRHLRRKMVRWDEETKVTAGPK